jgi:hypothetical protein
MSSMNDLLVKYKLNETVPEEVRERLYKNKRSNLVKALKRAGKYNTIFGFVLYFYFSIRAAGISVTLYQSMAIALSASLLTAGIVSTGAYVAVKKINKPVTEDIKIEKPVEQREKNNVFLPDKIAETVKKTKPVINTADYSKIQNKILFPPSPISGGIDIRQLKTINYHIKKELLSLRGPDNLIPLESPQASDAQYILTGSVDKINKIYTLNVKIFNKKTSKILYGSSVSFSSAVNIKNACKKIAHDISKNVK